MQGPAECLAAEDQLKVLHFWHAQGSRHDVGNSALPCVGSQFLLSENRLILYFLSVHVQDSKLSPNNFITCSSFKSIKNSIHSY